jgi:RNA polymerase sigma factor (sigma-70 family)
MVLAVCRRVLEEPHDVEDAFQATFLVLVRKARSVRRHETLGTWLFSVARRTATRARISAARRRAKERSKVERHTADAHFDAERDEARVAVIEEVGRLAEKYRAAVLLVYLQGLTHEAAARQLGWPVGTLKSRLSTARARLQIRLSRRGLGSSAALVTETTRSRPVPTALVDSTVRAALPFLSTGAIRSATVAVLTQGVLRAMLISKLNLTAAVLLVAAAISLGSAASDGQGPARAKTSTDRSSPQTGKIHPAEVGTPLSSRVGTPPEQDANGMREILAINFEWQQTMLKPNFSRELSGFSP